MAKSSAPAKTPSSTRASGSSIAAIRAQIDKVDRQLVRLVNQRAELAHRIGRLKQRDGQVVYDPVREEEVISRVLALSQGPLSNDCLRAVFRELISGSRALEKVLKVAFLGPQYTYSHLAALHRFGQSVEAVPVSSIAAVFEEVNAGHADFGLVPLENSTDGRIADTLDMFTRLPVRICGEVLLEIHHHLLGKCPRAEISEVYSKSQPLSQCRNWLARHLPQARSIEVTSTAIAAQLALEKPGAAAIASPQAGVFYGLDVLAEQIEDNPGNLTRFAVIGQHGAPRTGRDKTSLMFEVEHRPGGLADALNLFKRAGLNLTWIESFPIARPEGGYLFFVELDGHEHDSRVRKVVETLRRKALRLEVLGSYPRSQPIG